MYWTWLAHQKLQPVSCCILTPWGWYHHQSTNCFLFNAGSSARVSLRWNSSKVKCRISSPLRCCGQCVYFPWIYSLNIRDILKNRKLYNFFRQEEGGQLLKLIQFYYPNSLLVIAVYDSPVSMAWNGVMVFNSAIDFEANFFKGYSNGYKDKSFVCDLVQMWQNLDENWHMLLSSVFCKKIPLNIWDWPDANKRALGEGVLQTGGGVALVCRDLYQPRGNSQNQRKLQIRAGGRGRPGKWRRGCLSTLPCTTVSKNQERAEWAQPVRGRCINWWKGAGPQLLQQRHRVQT